MSKVRRSVSIGVLALSGLLTIAAKADTIETLLFTGTATCTDANCTSFGSGPLTGSYTLDVTTQTIIGSWSFDTPLGVMSSATAGATASVSQRLGDINAGFSETTPAEFVQFFFPGSDTDEIGPLATNLSGVTSGGGDACTPATSASCFPDYAVSGSTSLAPEPGSLAVASALLIAGMIVYRRRSRI